MNGGAAEQERERAFVCGKERVVHVEKFEPDDFDDEKWKEMMGPGAVDQTLRSTIQMVWMTLPKERKTLDELEKEVRRLIDRAFRDMREDEERNAK